MRVNELPLALLNLVLEIPYVLHLLLVINFTFLEGRLLDLDLLDEAEADGYEGSVEPSYYGEVTCKIARGSNGGGIGEG